MRKDIAITRAISPHSRRRVAFWLFLALLLTLATLIQLGHTITVGVAGADIGYSLMSADDQPAQDCPSRGEVTPDSHCGAASSCAAAIASTPASAPPFSAKTAQARASDMAAPGRAPSPFFHPPKLFVHA